MTSNRLDIAARILADWRPTCLAGNQEWPSERGEERSLTTSEYRAKVCRQALAWADSLIEQHNASLPGRG
jgi:hypothetical protein